MLLVLLLTPAATPASATAVVVTVQGQGLDVAVQLHPEADAHQAAQIGVKLRLQQTGVAQGREHEQSLPRAGDRDVQAALAAVAREGAEVERDLALGVGAVAVLLLLPPPPPQETSMARQAAVRANFDVRMIVRVFSICWTDPICADYPIHAQIFWQVWTQVT